jgi:hypothetical protein
MVNTSEILASTMDSKTETITTERFAMTSILLNAVVGGILRLSSKVKNSNGEEYEFK